MTAAARARVSATPQRRGDRRIGSLDVPFQGAGRPARRGFLVLSARGRKRNESGDNGGDRPFSSAVGFGRGQAEGSAGTPPKGGVVVPVPAPVSGRRDKPVCPFLSLLSPYIRLAAYLSSSSMEISAPVPGLEEPITSPSVQAPPFFASAT